jgi:phospholipase C
MANRREFLRLAALAAAGTALLPEVIRKAIATPAATVTGTIQDVQHVVIVMQENRSFDHYFGTFKGARGFGDPRPIPLCRGDQVARVDPVWHQPHGEAGAVRILPYPLHPKPVTPAVCFGGLPHDWKTSHAAVNQGRNDSWAKVKSPQSMAFYQGADIPFHFALAESFTLCDAYHCSLMGPTHPNRMFLMSGTNGQADAEHGPRIENSDHLYQFGWITYPERLEEAGISWQVYQNSLANDAHDPFGANNYGCNALQWFKSFDPAADRHASLVARGNSVRTIDDLRADVRAGKLAQVSWLIPTEGCSEHPQFPPAYGAAYLARVIEALTANEEVWSRTVLLITYDENDGFFDHMPPPMPPSPGGSAGISTVGVAEEFNKDGQPYGLGTRVPMIVVSPWSKGGWICSQVFDHTSVIRFLEARFGVIEPNISAWRRSVCGDLTSAFDFRQALGDRVALPDASGFLSAHPDTKSVHIPAAPADQSMPAQIPGIRPARLLPYQLSVDGAVDAGRSLLTLSFGNAGTAGAVFHAYDVTSPAAPRIYTVEAGTSLRDSWPIVAQDQGAYGVAVYGPNGLMRCFRGELAQARRPDAALPEIAATVDAAGCRMTLTLANRGASACSLLITPNAYSAAPARTVTVPPGGQVDDAWPCAGSGGWYDVSVTEAGGGSFIRRYAGHVEGGSPSTSDPAAGRVIAAAPFDA